MVSEFRALRATVLRLWTARQAQAVASDLEDIMRFNEAIDQAIAESLSKYTQEVNQSKERFLAILGHDWRTPVGAIITSSRFVLDAGGLPEQSSVLVAQIERSARRMNQLVADLLEFTRTRFGDQIPIDRAPTDLSRILRNVVSEIAASYRSSKVDVATSGDLSGQWDEDRIHQALTNLLSNAVQHGARDGRIRVEATGSGDNVVISIQNEGSPIAGEQLARIFEGAAEAGGFAKRDRRHLGLGLYIVDRIVKAHGGTVEVQSTAEAGTTFTVRLPRHA
jgi:signal transduction histidine kinase